MDGPNTTQIKIAGMGCASCVRRVEAALHAVPGVGEAAVNFATETATVTHAAPVSDVTRALSEAGYPAATQQVELQVDGMSCAACVRRIERILTDMSGVVAADVNLATRRANVIYLEMTTDPAELAKSLTQAGYPARPAQDIRSEAEGDAGADERQRLTRLVVVAAALALPVFLLEMGGHLIPAFHHWVHATLGTQTSHGVQFLLTTVLLLGPGRMFYAKGIPSLLRGAPDMNALVALGTGAAYVFSVIATFAPNILPPGTANVYFEAAAVIVVLILLGRLMEARAKGRTGAAIRMLVGLQPKTARVERNGAMIDLPVAEITTGDTVLIRPGERVPVDAEILDGTSYVDESMITPHPGLAILLRPGVHPVTGFAAACPLNRNCPDLMLLVSIEDTGKYLEPRPSKMFGDILHFNRVAQVRFVGAIFAHGFVIGDAAKLLCDRFALCKVLKHSAQYRLHFAQNVILLDKAHFKVKLVKLSRQTVGTRVFVTEARRYLEIGVETRHHDQLLVLLWCLRQRIKLTVMQSAWHQKIAGALRG